MLDSLSVWKLGGAMYGPIRFLMSRQWSPASRYAAQHEVPIDHLPPLGATVTPLAQKRRERETIKMHGTRSG
jgi:hypothetical protein